jgi:putative endonuclease
MYYTYVLQSLKNLKFYTGYTDNLKRRLLEHNSHQGGNYTRINAPFKLIFYEAYLHQKDAIEAESFFKTGYGREVLKGKIKNYLQS